MVLNILVPVTISVPDITLLITLVSNGIYRVLQCNMVMLRDWFVVTYHGSLPISLSAPDRKMVATTM
jgi:hypothetical protein